GIGHVWLCHLDGRRLARLDPMDRFVPTGRATRSALPRGELPAGSSRRSASLPAVAQIPRFWLRVGREPRARPPLQHGRQAFLELAALPRAAAQLLPRAGARRAASPRGLAGLGHRRDDRCGPEYASGKRADRKPPGTEEERGGGAIWGCGIGSALAGATRRPGAAVGSRDAAAAHACPRGRLLGAGALRGAALAPTVRR